MSGSQTPWPPPSDEPWWRGVINHAFNGAHILDFYKSYRINKTSMLICGDHVLSKGKRGIIENIFCKKTNSRYDIYLVFQPISKFYNTGQFQYINIDDIRSVQVIPSM